jgi:hypothetical protein
MRIVISEFISLDGVVQAPGGRDEDMDGGFQHGGWSMPFFDPEVMGSSIDEVAQRTDALLYGRRTWQVMAGPWPGRAGDCHETPSVKLGFVDFVRRATTHRSHDHRRGAVTVRLVRRREPPFAPVPHLARPDTPRRPVKGPVRARAVRRETQRRGRVPD